MKQTIEEGNKKLKFECHKEMKDLKDDIVREAHIYANDKLKNKILDIQSTLTLALTGMQQITSFVNSNLVLEDQPNVK